MQAKKSLGQNFLKSESAINAMIEAGDLQAGDFVFEIGPGQGALTEKILEKDCKVLAVEKDTELIGVLEEKFIKELHAKQLRLVDADILSFDPRDIRSPYKLIANIPYYITGAIIRSFLETKNQPEKMVLLIQKEVAVRIAARDNKESILSIAVKSYCDPKLVKNVPAGSFVPAPRVDSAIIKFENISKKFFLEHKIEEKHFFEVLRAGFAHKRKMLRANLQNVAEKYGKEIGEVFETLKIKEKIRPENLELADWGRLAKEITA